MLRNKREVIKHSAAIYIENNITLLQRRAWNVLLAYAYDDLLMKEEHAIKVRDLMRILEFDSKNEEYLKEALEALVTCKLKWNILGKDLMEWGVTTLLSEAIIRNGTCLYGYGKTLRERLHNPRMYARISLSMQNKFTSKHAQALWEMCVDCLDEARNYGESRFIALDLYRELMGLGRTMYPVFKDLGKYVIKAPLEEINEVTDFHVEAEYQRVGRKVVAVKFKVRRVQMLPGQVAKQGALFAEVTDMPTAVRELKNAGMAADEAWKIWQEGFNYVDAEKRPANLKESPEAAFDRYVMEKVHLLKRQQEAGKVKNITGFLRTAIKKNFANPEFVSEEAKKKLREDTKNKDRSERKLQILEEQKNNIVTARDKELHQLCERIAKETPTLLDKAATELFKDNPVLRKACQPEKSLFENYQEKPMLRVIVDQYLIDHHPELFLEVLNRYRSQLSAMETKAVAREQATT